MDPGAVVADRFRIECEVGSGGLGTVYKAIDLQTGMPVALKRLHGEGDAATALRFEREARLLATLEHRGIVRYVAHGPHHLAMEWLEGSPLTSVLERQGKLSVDRALHIARGIGRALAAAHTRGIVHRDLKPDNVFLVTRGEDPDFAKVLDFGIAKLLANEGAGAPKIACTASPMIFITVPLCAKMTSVTPSR